MPDKRIEFRYTLGKARTRAEFERGELMLRSIPQIEEYLDELRRRDFSKMTEFSQKSREEAVKIYNHIVEDGRYVSLMREDVAAACEKLDIKIDRDALTVLTYIANKTDDLGSVQGPVEAVIAIAVVIAIAADDMPVDGFVIDESAQLHLKL